MASPKTISAFWRRLPPPFEYDIAKLRPATLPKGSRFETKVDADSESKRSEKLLRDAKAPRHLFEYLSECRARDYNCEKTYCPRCARWFRGWLIGELLRINKDGPKAQIATVLLAASDDIKKLDPAPFRHSLRKRLDRSGLSNAPVIGGFEMAWRAKENRWVLHANLLIIGAADEALSAFLNSFQNAAFVRPTVLLALRDPAEQLSYLLKFTTYHRPFQQIGNRPSAAKPLNAKEHVALIKWMDQYSFSDMLFLYGVRREGAVLRLTQSTSAQKRKPRRSSRCL